MTESDRFKLNRFSLKFHNSVSEQTYQDFVLNRTVTYCRVAWILFFVAGVSFGILDRTSFGGGATLVMAWRVVLVSVAASVIGISFSKRHRRLLRFSAPLFVITPGLFTTLLLAMGAPHQFSPYFTSFCFAFAGMLTTPGLGFASGVIAMLVSTAVFNAVFLMGGPLSCGLLLTYNFFLAGLITVFTTAGYWVEWSSRHDFAVSSELRDSLEHVKTLRGLLPICASCKKIRDDNGYWRQIEFYVTAHTDAAFTHGICPECAEMLYPEMRRKPN